MVAILTSMLPQGCEPNLASSAAGFQAEGSKSAQFQRSAGLWLVSQEESIDTTMGSPVSNRITNLPMRPAGLGASPPLMASIPIALAPGCRRPVTSGV